MYLIIAVEVGLLPGSSPPEGMCPGTMFTGNSPNELDSALTNAPLPPTSKFSDSLILARS